MKNTSQCFRTMQAAVWAVCLFLFTALAGAQVVPVALDIHCPTNVTLWTCSDTAIWQSPLPVPSGGCSNYNVTCTPPVGAALPLGIHTVTCRVIDGCQNSDTCTFTITVRRDTEPPVIRCPSNIVERVCPTAAGGCGGIINYPAPTATDNSGVVSAVVCNPPSGSFFACGVHVVTCVVFDRCQNRDTCEFTITVEPGGQPPSIQCPPDQTILTCSNTAVLIYPLPVVVPAGTTVVCVPPPGVILPLGSHAVTCIASNACGTAQCSFKVEVRPVPPPSIVCPNTMLVTAPCGSNCVPVTYSPTVVNGTLAGCSPPSGSCLPLGVTTVTCVATNRCGDRALCEFLVRVSPGQGQPPQITCPNDITVTTCSNTCQVVTYPAPIVNNGVLVRCSPPSGFCFPIGTTTVLCEASNACARAECNFTVTVRPVPPPSIVCPTNELVFTVPCNSNCVPVTYGLPPVLNGAIVACNPPSGTCLPVGIHTITCVATNICGDRDVCQFRVRVVPGQGPPPQIICPNDLTFTTCSNCVVVTYPPPIVNNGVLIKCDPPSGFCFPIGSTIVTCEASNACARAECKFTVTVRRVPPPTIHCPSNQIVLTVPCGSNCVPVVYPPPTVSNGTLVGCNPPLGTCLPVGLHPVICRAVNDCGDRAECEFVVRVIQGQDQPPIIRCPDDIVVTACSNTCEVVSYPAPTVINGVLVGCAPPSGACFPLGVTTVTCVASNACGRAECKFTVTVRPGSACVKPPLNMVLWLPFDEPAGIIAHNIVPGAPNGVHFNGPIPLLGQHVLNSLGFDGLNDLVRVPNYAAIQLSVSDFSIDAWILPRENTGSRTIVSKVQVPLPGTLTPTRGYEFYLRLGRLNLDLFGAAYQNYDSGVVVPMDNAWHHVAVTVRRGGGGNVRFYLDGALVNSQPGPITAPLGNSTRLQVGHSTQSGPGPMVPFRGHIDEVEIFRRALTPAEVAGLWNADRAGKCKIKCAIPWDVSYPPGQPYVTVLARIWNCSAIPQPITWTASGPMPIPTPAGSFILPPFTCTNVPVQLCRPTNGLPVGAIVRWNLSVQSGNQCPIVCVGSVINPGLLIVRVPDLPIGIPGTSRVERVRVSLNGLPPGQPLRLYAVGPDMRLDTMAVSLNGLPPGTPWIIGGPDGAGAEADNGGDSLDVPVRFVDADPTGLYTVLIQTDVDGDEAFDTVASFDVENPAVPPPSLQIANREGRYFILWEDGGDGFGILETAKEVDGPWDPIPNALPAYPIDPGELKQFFRVVVPGE